MPANASRSRRRAKAAAAALAAAAVLAALVAVPWIAGFAVQRLLVEVFTVFAIAQAWNLLAGYGGMVAIGQHMFVGIGAYALFLTSNRLGLNPWLALPAAAAASAVFALAAAWPMFRLRGANFAVGTWVLAEMLRIGAVNSQAVGAGGGMPLETIREIDRATRNAGTYWAALAVGVGTLLVARALLRGRLGLALTSVRDSEDAAQASGVSTPRTKLALWIISAIITGTAGAVAYISTLQVTPDACFSLNWTASAIFIAVLGGIGTLEGPILGTAVYFLLREFFSDYGAWYFVALGVIAIATMVFAPSGAWGFVRRIRPFDPFGLRRDMPPR
jgi:branched-chain amino acid transport system permease protein